MKKKVTKKKKIALTKGIRVVQAWSVVCSKVYGKEEGDEIGGGDTKDRKYIYWSKEAAENFAGRSTLTNLFKVVPVAIIYNL